MHWYYMTKTDLARRIRLHPKREEILKRVISAQGKTDVQSWMPTIIDRIVTEAEQTLLGRRIFVSAA